MLADVRPHALPVLQAEHLIRKDQSVLHHEAQTETGVLEERPLHSEKPGLEGLDPCTVGGAQTLQTECDRRAFPKSVYIFVPFR